MMFRFTRRTWTVPRRLQFLFLFLALASVAISIALNMAFVTILISDEIVHHTMMILPEMPTKTILIYICNDLYDKMQIRKVRELQSYFGKDLMVVTDRQDIQDYSILPTEQVISPYSNVTLTATSNYTSRHVCCSQERGIMWLISNQDKYDYVWIMEDDVLWSNFVDLKDFFQSYSRGDDTDLLHINYGMEENDLYDLSHWWPFQRLLPPYIKTPRAMFHPPFHQGIFQFCRLSSRFVAALNDWRLKNDGEWTHFEPLFANLPFRNDTPTKLTTKNYINNSIGYEININWRPCYSVEQVYNKTNSKGGRGGLFHPVKKNASTPNCRQQYSDYH